MSLSLTPDLVAALKRGWRASVLSADLPKTGARRDAAALAFAIGAALAVEEMRGAMEAIQPMNPPTANLTALAFLVSVRGASVLDAD